MSTKRSYESIFPYLLPMVLISLTLISGTALSSSSASADDSVVSTATITVPVSCSIIGTTTTTHTAEIPNGIDSRSNDYYPDGIGTTTVKAYCNDNEGFAIYAVGYTGDIIGNTYLRDSTLGQTSDIQTSTTFSGANSAWAMKIGVTNGTYPSIVAGSAADSEKQSGDLDYSAWQAIPSTYTRVAYRNSATDVNTNSIASAEGSSVTTTYAAYISPTQNSGTYIGQVKYTLVHPASEEPLQPQTANSGCINYFANASTAVGTMGCQSISASDTSAMLVASNFSRDGYGFAGWSDAYDYATNPNANIYGSSETITFTAGQYTGANPGLSLYAIWIKSRGSFQDSSESTYICDGLTQASVGGTKTLASVSALTDARDNQTYAIAKLADGKCWMIENLRLDNTAELTLANTNNPLNDGANVTLKHNYTDTTTYNTLSATSAGAYDENTAPDGWCTSINASCFDQSRLRTDNTSNRKSYTITTPMYHGSNHYSYGNYYNWYSATAGRGIFSFETKNESVIGDLCPANWRLPRGGDKANETNNEYWSLIVTALNSGVNPLNHDSSSTPFYGSTDSETIQVLLRTYPNNFVRSGYVYNGNIREIGIRGDYWSSTTEGASTVFFFRFETRSVHPGTLIAEKSNGQVVRCLASASAP